MSSIVKKLINAINDFESTTWVLECNNMLYINVFRSIRNYIFRRIIKIVNKKKIANNRKKIEILIKNE